MSFNKIQEKKSYDIISDSDSESDNESDNESDDNECNEKNISGNKIPDISKILIEKKPLIDNKIKIMNINNDSINDSVDNELCELLNETTLDDIKSNKIKDKEEILELIKSNISERFTDDIFKSLKTKSGNTQQPERNYIEIIKSLFDDLELTYTLAGSQQSKDFRNINNTGLNIEVKKTDKFIIKCNDTCPSEDIDYLIIFTGVNYKTKENIKPQILFINGQQIIEECNWLSEYQKDIEYLKNKYCRGENKKNLDGAISVYVRPNYDVDIRKLNLNLN